MRQDFAGEAEADTPAEGGVADRQQPRRQHDVDHFHAPEHGRCKQRDEQRAGGKAQRDPDGAGDGGQCDRRGKIDQGQRREPGHAVGADADRTDPDACDDGGQAGDAYDAQVLHQRHQAGIGAELPGHDHHGRGGARRDAPDGGRARQQGALAHHPAEQAAGKEDHQHHAEQQRPVAHERDDDVGRQGVAHQAADDGLTRQRGQARHADGGAVDAEQDAGEHRPEQESGRQAYDLEQRGEKQGNE